MQQSGAAPPVTDLIQQASSSVSLPTSGSLIAHHPHGIQFLSAIKSLRPSTMPASIFDVGGSLFQRASPLASLGVKRAAAVDLEESENSSDSDNDLSMIDGDAVNMGVGFGDAMLDGITYRDGPRPGKKTKGRVKIKMEFIENKLRRYTTFSKRKTGIMKKAYELSTLTGTQVMLLVASETGHVYTFATRKLQPMITSESGKALIQTCLNSPDCPSGAVTGGLHGKHDQRMNPTGFEEPDLSYAVSDEESGNHGFVSKKSHRGQGQPPFYTEPLSLTVHPSSLYRPTPNTNTLPPSRPPAGTSMATDLRSVTSSSSAVNLLKTEPSERTSPSSVTSLLNPINLVRPKDTMSSVNLSAANIAGHVSRAEISTGSTVQQLSVTTGGQSQGQTFYTIPGTNQIISLPGGSNVPGTVVYQTPQGLVYATPTKGVDSLSEGGYILNLPQTPALTEPKNGAGQQFISIPVPVSMAFNSQIFRTLMAQQQQTIKSEATPTDLRYKVLDSNKQ